MVFKIFSAINFLFEGFATHGDGFYSGLKEFGVEVEGSNCGGKGFEV